MEKIENTQIKICVWRGWKKFHSDIPVKKTFCIFCMDIKRCVILKQFSIPIFIILNLLMMSSNSTVFKCHNFSIAIRNLLYFLSLSYPIAWYYCNISTLLQLYCTISSSMFAMMARSVPSYIGKYLGNL